MKIFIGLIGLAFVGCSMVDVTEQTPLSNMTWWQAWKWIDENITYKADIVDDFQLPETTYRLRTGDCEDFCILLMSVMNEQGPAPKLVCIRYNNSIHYIIYWKNEYFEPQTNNMQYSREVITKDFLWSYSYERAISMSH